MVGAPVVHKPPKKNRQAENLEKLNTLNVLKHMHFARTPSLGGCISANYSGTSEQRTHWEQGLRPL